MPTLRERREDVPLLVEHSLSFGRGRCASFHPKVSERLVRYDLPGNDLELKHLVMRACVLAEDGVVGPEDLPPLLSGGGPGMGRMQRVMRTAAVLYDRVARGGDSFWEAVWG